MLIVIALFLLIIAIAVAELAFLIKCEPTFDEWLVAGIIGAFIITVLITFIGELL